MRLNEIDECPCGNAFVNMTTRFLNTRAGSDETSSDLTLLTERTGSLHHLGHLYTMDLNHFLLYMVPNLEKCPPWCQGL